MTEDEELEQLRRKRLAELQMQAAQQAQEEEERRKAEAVRSDILRQLMTPEARERLGRLKMAYPKETEDIENQLIQLAQTGRLNRPINDEEMKQLLAKVMPKRREINIRRI